MKKLLLFISTILFGLNLWAQPRFDTVYYDGYRNSNKIHQIIQTKGTQSKTTTYATSGKIQEVFRKVDGKLEGEFIRYFTNGKIAQESNYHNGLLEGKDIQYFQNSKVKSLYTCNGGYHIGAYKLYNEAGVLLQKGSYDTIHQIVRKQIQIKEVFSGKYLENFQNGKPAKIAEYDKGKLNGLYLEYYFNGMPKSKIQYKNGLICGTENYWYENGNPRKQGNTFQVEPINGQYFQPTYNGKKINFYENGIVSSIENYENYLPHGQWRRFYENGNPSEEKYYDNGQLSQSGTTFYTSGKVYEVRPYKRFNLLGRDTALIDGLFQSYYENGNLMQESFYVKGEKLGLFKQYFSDGKLERVLYFFGSNDNYALLQEYTNKGILVKEGTYEIDSLYPKQIRKLLYAIYDEDGKPIYRTQHRKAAAIGAFQSFFEDGKVAVEGNVFRKNNSEYFSLDDLGIAWKVMNYPSGALRYEVFVMDYFKHGQIIEWFPDGHLKRFLDPYGLDIQWLQNGEIMVTQCNNPDNNLVQDTVLNKVWLNQLYKDLSSTPAQQRRINNSKDGVQASYYAPGKKHFETVIAKGSFDQYFVAYTYTGDTLAYLSLSESEPNGKYLVKNVDGTLFCSGSYKNGIPVGEWKQHNRKGIPQLFYTIDVASSNEKIHTKEIEFYETGVEKSRSFFTQGKHVGWNLRFHPNGKIQDSVFYNLDTIDGRCTNYSDEGKPYSLTYYHMGKRQGLHQQWYYKDQGSGLMRIEHYEADKRHGEARYYFPNGKLNLIAYFNKGLEDSVWKYYDSTGMFQRGDYYKKGKKELKPLVGKCACRDKESGKGFAQSLSSLLNDETDINLWQFPFHESIEPILKSSFFTNLQTSNNQERSYYGFNLINFKPMKIGIPNKSGMKLWLNPCWHPGEESTIEMGISLSEHQPEETNVNLSPGPIAYILPQRIFIGSAGQEVLAKFETKSIDYDKDGIQFDEIASVCMEPCMLLNENYSFHADTFALENVYHKKIFNRSYFQTDQMDELLIRELQIKNGSNPILIKSLSGKLNIRYKGNNLRGAISYGIIASGLFAAYLEVPDLSVENGKLVQTKNGKQTEIHESELYQQMKTDGFSQVIGKFNPESKALEIMFYIKRP